MIRCIQSYNVQRILLQRVETSEPYIMREGVDSATAKDKIFLVPQVVDRRMRVLHLLF